MSRVYNLSDGHQSDTDSLKVRAFKYVRSCLMTGKFLPGQKIVIDQLAKELGTSQTPVREALHMLAQQNVLDVKKASSYRVPHLSSKRYIEIRKIRIELQCLAAREAIARIKDVDSVVAQLEETHEQLITAQEKGDMEKMLECNERFSMILTYQSKMPALISIVESLWMQAGPVIHLIFKDRIPTFVGPHPHLILIAGVKRQSPETVCQAITDILMESGDVIIKQLRKDGH